MMCPIIGNTTCSRINESTLKYKELTGSFKHNKGEDKEQVMTSPKTNGT